MTFSLPLLPGILVPAVTSLETARSDKHVQANNQKIDRQVSHLKQTKLIAPVHEPIIGFCIGGQIDTLIRAKRARYFFFLHSALKERGGGGERYRDRQTDRDRGTETDRQTQRQTETDRDRKRHRKEEGRERERRGGGGGAGERDGVGSVERDRREGGRQGVEVDG